MSKTKFALDLVERQGEKIFTTSLVISELFGRPHFRVIKSIKSLIDRGKLTTGVVVSSWLDSTGRSNTLYQLDERSALIAMPFIGGEKAEEGQVRLVDAFLAIRKELDRIHRQQSDPNWQRIRQQTKEAFRLVALVLQETRKLQGKETEKHHYTNEARLMNGVLTGKYKSLARDELNDQQLCLLDSIEQENSRMMIQGRTYQERKQSLLDKFIPKLPETLH